jgi:hypothetical protein
VLTKRAERAYRYLGRSADEQEQRKDAIGEAGHADHEILFSGAPDCPEGFHFLDWPLPNVRLGVSVENQPEADKRVPLLLQTPAAVRWLSIEPLLGPVDLSRHLEIKMPDLDGPDEVNIQWVVVGGESGPGARPMHPDWARSLRDQCQAAGVAFFFKQWGAWAPLPEPFQYMPAIGSGNREYNAALRRFKKAHGASLLLRADRPDGWQVCAVKQGEALINGDYAMGRVGKKKAGRLLDGREHSEFPSML